MSDLGFFSVVAMSDRNYFVEDSYSIGNLDTYGISASTIGVMDAETISQALDGEAAGAIAGALTGDNLESLGADQAAGMANAMDAAQISDLTSDQANGIATAIADDPTQMTQMESGSVAAMAATLDAEDLGVLGSEMVGTMVASMDSDQVQDMSPEHLAEALDTVGADYMGSGASGFDEVESAETFMSEAPIEAPASLTEMMDSEGAASCLLYTSPSPRDQRG